MSQSTVDNPGDELENKVLRAISAVREAAELIETGKTNLWPSKFDFERVEKLTNDITDEINTGQVSPDEMAQHMAKLQEELLIALPLLIKYCDDPESSKVGINYRVRLISSIAHIKEILELQDSGPA